MKEEFKFHLVNWSTMSTICLSLQYGGLRVRNLIKFNQAFG